MVYIVLIIYILITFGIAIYWSTTSRSSLEDYILGGRSINRWVLAFTTSATSLSGFLVLGFGGFAYQNGFGAKWLAFGVMMGVGCAVWVVGERLRKYSLEVNALTVSDFLESRYYDSRKKTIRLITAFLIIFAVSVYTMVQIVATAKLAEYLFGWSYFTGVLLSTLFIMIYTAIGGYLAVVWTDLIQGILMVVGSLIAAYIGITNSGGISNMLHDLNSIDQNLVEGSTPFITIIGFILGAGILGYMSQPQLQVRFMSAKNRREMLNTLPIVVVVHSILIFGMLWAASGARAIYPTADMLPNGDTDMAVIHMIFDLAPPIFSAIFVVTVFATIMSTADSLLIMASGSVTEDIISKSLEKNYSQRKLVIIGQITVIVVGLIAMILALRPFEAIFWMAEWAWGALTAFGPPVLLGLYWKRTTREGCIAGLIIALIVSVLWSTPSLIGAYEIVHMSLPTFITGALVTIIVSLLTKKPPKEVINTFERTRTTNAKVDH